jgi:aspartyl-tRNA(Asn)/glutamyl-tRNA(Gln) amidotransferase subunit C
MTLSLAEIEHIAALARLRLTDEEKDRYRGQLSAVLDYMAKLRQIDTAHIEPTATVLPLRIPLRVLDTPAAEGGGQGGAQAAATRPDEVRPSLPLAELLANAPAAEGGTFRVPPVLE